MSARAADVVPANDASGDDPRRSSGPHRRVQSRLLRVFVLQLALISAVTALGVLAAASVAERLLVNRALVGEADYFWKRHAEDPDFPLPDTLNLHAWLSPDATEALPEGLEALPVGRQRLVVDDVEHIVHVSEHGDERLYLLFESETVSRLAFWFGLVPLTLVLLVMYGLAGLAYLLSKRAVSPLTRLAAAIETFDFAARDAAELDLGELRDAPDSETRVLVDALGHFIARSQRSLERERDFTRYASHELRTPLAVIAGSVSTLELSPLEGAPARAVARIGRTTRHMSELLGALLLLVRDARDTDGDDVTDVGELVDRLAAELDDLGDDGSVPIVVERRATLLVGVSEAPLTIVLGNLLRNARTYTLDGRVEVRIETDAVSVVDTGPGLDERERRRVFEPFYRGDAGDRSGERSSAGGGATRPSDRLGPGGTADAVGKRPPGLGLGLAIARKTCDNQGWRITLESTPGVGSTFRVAFGRTVVGSRAAPTAAQSVQRR